MARPIMAIAAIALGVSAGAMLTEQMVLVPYWQSLPPAEFLRWFAANEPRLVAFYGALEIVSLTITFLATAMCAVRREDGVGRLVLASLLAAGVLAVYPMYFQAVNARFAAGTVDVADVAAELGRWRTWQWLRVALGAGAFIAALGAVAALARGPEGSRTPPS
jgi:hypothetical protein